MGVSVLEQARIQARVLVPVVKALKAEVGEARAHALVSCSCAVRTSTRSKGSVPTSSFNARRPSCRAPTNATSGTTGGGRRPSEARAVVRSDDALERGPKAGRYSRLAPMLISSASTVVLNA